MNVATFCMCQSPAVIFYDPIGLADLHSHLMLSAYAGCEQRQLDSVPLPTRHMHRLLPEVDGWATHLLLLPTVQAQAGGACPRQAFYASPTLVKTRPVNQVPGFSAPLTNESDHVQQPPTVVMLCGTQQTALQCARKLRGGSSICRGWG